jgi:hypothetical protein
MSLFSAMYIMYSAAVSVAVNFLLVVGAERIETTTTYSKDVSGLA